MNIGERIFSIGQNTFLRNVGVLTVGSVAGRAVALVALPILTRLYSPEAFGALAVFLALTTIISSVAGLRFDVAIPLPRSHAAAANLFALALLSSTTVSVFLFLSVLIAPGVWTWALNSEVLLPHLWLIPLAAWSATLFSAVQYWSTRHSRFGSVAASRVGQSLLGSGAAIAMGSLGSLGLLIGNMLTTSAGSLQLFWLMLLRDRQWLALISPRRMLVTLRRHARFPKYATLEAFANSASTHLPIIIIGALAQSQTTGLILLAMQVVMTPINLATNSIGQVLYARAPEALREGRLPDLVTTLLRNQIRFGVAPLVFSAFLFPAAFDLAFGTEWRRAGTYAFWLAPWAAALLLASPTSTIMYVRNQQQTLMLIMLAAFVFRTVAVAAAFTAAPAWGVPIFAASGAIVSFVTLPLYTHYSGVTLKAATTLFRAALTYCLPAAAAGWLAQQLLLLVW